MSITNIVDAELLVADLYDHLSAIHATLSWNYRNERDVPKAVTDAIREADDAMKLIDHREEQKVELSQRIDEENAERWNP